MCMIKKSWEGRHKGLMRLELFFKKLQRCLPLLGPSRGPDHNDVELDEDMETAKMIPKDVKKGHFAVIAVKGGRSTRFILELGYLTDPAFLRLLEEAEQEYGFQQKGPLAIPCQPEEVQKILEYRRKKPASF